MDFVSLASGEHSFLRKLDQMLADDDQASSRISADPVPNTILPNSPSSSLYQDGETTYANTPFLSKNAEAELYLLATNFLLYTALVIVVILVCKLYFPEWLERSAVEQPRQFNYRVAQEQDYFDSEDSDGEEGENDMDNDKDEQDENTEGTGGEKWLEFKQETMTKRQVLQRLILCSLMLNLTFVLWGVLQERMLTRRYPRYTGEYFVFSYALVFTNRFWTLILSLILWLYFKPRRSRSILIYEYSFPSISNMLSSWCQYEALRYVSFPATTLFKSFKIAPVMLMGKILGNKSYPQYDYLVALTIGVGIAMFMTSTDDLNFESSLAFDFQHDYLDRKVGTAWTGVMLLFLFLFFDSFTSQFQSRLFQRHHDLSLIELLLATSAFSTVLSFITLLHTQELYPALEFVIKHSEIHLHFLLFSICSTIGQLMIFYTIKNFGAVVFAFIMTLRICLSIGLSCVLYGHKVSATGFFGLLLVVSGVLYRIRRKAASHPLLKWQGMEDASKAFELVHEWHEHVDM